MKMQRPRPFCLLGTLLVVLCFPAVAVEPQAIPQVGGAARQSSAPERKDSYGRETPRATVLNFLKYAHRGDFKTAAKFLQLSAIRQNQGGEELARELLTLMDTNLRASIGTMSDSPEGYLDDDPDPNLEVVGQFVVSDQQATFFLVRVFQDSTGPIWLVSAQTLTHVPLLYKSAGSPALDRYLPSALAEASFFGISLGRWLALLLSIPLALLLGSAVGRLAAWLWRRRPHSTQPGSRFSVLSFHKPISVILAVLLHGGFVFFIGIPLYYRVYYFRLLVALLVLSSAWLGSNILEGVHRRSVLRTKDREVRSFLQLIHQLLRVSLFCVAVLVVLAFLGIDTKAILAGVGIGGIAVALAAQKTLENLFGGITLVMDKVFAVGDDCLISDRQVTIRDIGLRSITMSTREGTEISFPNGMLSQNSIENLSRRTKFLISSILSISYESSLAQFAEALTQVRTILTSHHRVEHESARFCLSRLSPLGYEVELSAYVLGADIAEFSAIREDVLVRIMKILESVGAILAIPTQVSYVSKGSPTGQPLGSRAEQEIETSQDRSHTDGRTLPDASAKRPVAATQAHALDSRSGSPEEAHD
jgi:MscS family membrane protein